MPLVVSCPACGQTYRLSDDLAGHTVRCQCGRPLLCAMPSCASQVGCPHCRASVQHVQEYAGTAVACPHCGKPFVMPSIGAWPAQPPPLPSSIVGAADVPRIVPVAPIESSTERSATTNERQDRKGKWGASPLVGMAARMVGSIIRNGGRAMVRAMKLWPLWLLAAVCGLLAHAVSDGSIGALEASLHLREMPQIDPALLEAAIKVGFILTLIVLYFLPFLIAVLRRHPSAAAIFAVNLLLGWSGVPWVVALAWSLSAIEAGKRYR